MKILKITTLYPAYISDFYDRSNGLHRKTYAEQKATIDYDGFGWADFWSRALTPLGYEVMEIAANVEPLQKAWAKENGVKFHEEDWIRIITMEQVRKFQPTILFMDEFTIFSFDWLKEVKQSCSSILMVIGWCGAPFADPTVFKAYDLVLSCIPELVDHFKALGLNSLHLHHAFEPTLLNRLDDVTIQNIDLSFIGSIVRENSFHGYREQILIEIANYLPVHIYCPSNSTKWAEIKLVAKGLVYDFMQALKVVGFANSQLAAIPVVGKAATWSSRPILSVHPRLKRLMNPPVFGLKMYQILQRSKMTLNVHIDVSSNSASNLRLFEATGVGACLITDWRENLSDLFEADQEVVAYRSSAECIEKVKWLLDHSKERQAIAKAGQLRTLRDHTYHHRAVQLDQIIRGILKKKVRFT